MKKGIMINDKHTFNDFGAILASRKDEFPDIVRVTESVPYSDVVHDFSALYGDVSYTQREVVYRFKFIGEYATMMRDKLADFFFSIAASAVDIYDDEMGSDYHWHGCLQSVKRVDTVGEQFGARMIEVTFLCDYQRVPNESDFYEADSAKWPDVDGDGVVTSADASMIMHAVSEIGLDHPSGLTPEQEIMADCDRDGSITAVDGSLALKFVSECGVDRFENTPEGWARFLNVMFGKDTKEI
jgi:hypothetical protein